MKKRILPALLALCMVMSLLPAAFAVTPTKCSCDGSPTGCSHGDGECTKTEGLSETQSVCNTCKAAKEADDANEEEEGKETTSTTSTNENVSCAAVAAYAKTEDGLKDEGIGTDPHKDAKCAASGCKCGVKITTVTTTKNADGVVTKTETKVTYKYASAMCDACKANATCNPCTGKDGCTASTHKEGCPLKCYYCSNTKGSTEVTVKIDGKDVTKAICDTCAKDAAKNACGAGLKDGKGACTLVKGHTEKHNSPNCTEDIFCNAATHNENCPNRCKALDSANAVDTDTGENLVQQPTSGVKCTLPAGHEGPHNNTVCVSADDCGAGTHFKGTHPKKTDAEGNETEEEDLTQWTKEPCPNASTATSPAKTCGVGGCTRPKGHDGDHTNTECLGYNDDGYCNPKIQHIAGCKKYVECKCNHAYNVSGKSGKDEWMNGKFTAVEGGCTEKADCPNCVKWNAFVTSMKAAHDAQQKAYLEDQAAGGSSKTAPSEFSSASDLAYCSCVACGASKTNPGMGAVVDAEGNPVDPAEPTTPDVPTKAEDFTDMEDWMAEAVQTMLDNGWMEGMNNGKFEGRSEANTNMVLTVIARMDGETITGATWADDAKAWAEENELAEGIEITKSEMARKDVILMLWRLAGKPESDFELTFTDVDGLEGDHLTAMKWAAENKIVLGNGDDTVTPDSALKRAELAAMVARYAALEK